MPGKHALLGASGAHIWLTCTPAPRLAEKMPDNAGEDAAAGTLAHSIGELKLRKRFTTSRGPKKYQDALAKLQADSLYAKEMDACTDEYVDAVNTAALGFPELPYVAMEQKVDYSQWVPEGFGTSDALLIGAGILHIFDYKHGKGVKVEAEDNPQMKLYALGAWARYNLFYNISRVRWTIVQPRNGGVSETQELMLEDLLEWAETYVRPRAQLAYEGKGDFCPGEHCRFCRAKATCRARSDANLALEGFQKALPQLLAASDLGAILTRGQDLAAWLSDIEEYCLSFLLDGGEIPGWKAVEGRATRKWTDQKAAFDAAIAAGQPEAMLYVREPLTLAKVEELMGKKSFAAALQQFVHVPPGKPTLAPEKDKREPITNRPTAAQDFSTAPGAQPSNA